MWWRKFPFYFREVRLEDIQFSGDPEDAEFVVWLCTRYLRRLPNSAPVVLVRARCFEVQKKKAERRADVELAYALDDTFIPSIYAYAHLLLDDGDIGSALPLFALIKDSSVARDGVDLALSEICMRQAKADVGCEYQLRSWLENFDNIRHANGHLFKLTYSNATELACAQEHKFWADTLLPLENTGKQLPRKKTEIPTLNLGLKKTAKRERKKIGYWGSDFKEHSVRYFSRPLIENHDHESWEIYVYDDNFMGAAPDQHTLAFMKAVEYYYDTSSWEDERVVELILSHQLDVLVDITGHTSANRLHLWQRRLARLQITGLAYPPTTGLSSIDYKMVDIHMVNGDSHRHYTERQLIMPKSFWCFDPREEAYYTDIPPYKSTGHLTFACMGNGAKISSEVMRAWGKILDRVSNVRLLVVSHSFSDELIVKYFKGHMENAGVDMSRVVCRTSFHRDELWQRYGEVDMILDTYPFNGGTTSCWATYAGVPVLTMAGKSLSSCMGKSIMTNLGFPEFVTANIDEYIDKAIWIAENPGKLDEFRSVARARFLETSLGNGKKYAAEFELICSNLLERPAQVPAPDVPPLPLGEMLRRAQMVWYCGNIAACERILSQCRIHYGDAVEIAELQAETMLGQKQFQQFSDLRSTLGTSHKLMHFGALCDIVVGDIGAATETVHALLALDRPVPDLFGLQARLWRAWLDVHEGTSAGVPLATPPVMPSSATKVVFWLVHERDSEFELQKTQIEKLLRGISREVVFEKISKHERADRLNALLAEYSVCKAMVVIAREGVEFADPEVLQTMESALQQADVVGAAGALRWEQKDWALDLPEFKAWGLMRPSRLNESLFELHYAGVDARPVVDGAVVLDGKLLAFFPSRVSKQKFDDDMGDPGLWIEEDWCHRLFLAGYKLSVHRALGVVVHPTQEMQSFHTAAGQKGLLERINFDPLRLPFVSHDVVSVQVESRDIGVKIGKIFTGISS